MRRIVLLSLALVVVAVVCPRQAGAFVYWSDGAGTGSLGRADLTGASSPGDQWLPGLAPGCGVAVDGSHVYWTTRAGTIGRANLDGSGASENFIALPTGWACGVAADASHLYWASNSSGKLGRANLDGSGVQTSWMSPGTGHGCGVAVDETSVYWASASGVYSAPLWGGPATTISSATTENCGVAVNANHVYWATAAGYIERDLLGGGPPTAIVRASLGPCGVAVDSHYVYWGNSESDTIGRSNLDGSGVDQRFAEGARSPCGVAVDPLGPSGGRGEKAASPAPAPPSSPAPPSNAFRLGRVTKNRRRGTARLEVLLPGPGIVVLAGRRVKEQRVLESVLPAAREVAAGLTATEIAVRPRYRTRAILRVYGTAIAPISVTYTPVGGAPRTRYTRVWLALEGEKAGGRGRAGGLSRPYRSGCSSIFSSCRWSQGNDASSWSGYLPSK